MNDMMNLVKKYWWAIVLLLSLVYSDYGKRKYKKRAKRARGFGRASMSHTKWKEYDEYIKPKRKYKRRRSPFKTSKRRFSKKSRG